YEQRGPDHEVSGPPERTHFRPSGRLTGGASGARRADGDERVRCMLISGGFRETQDMAVRILDVEITRSPGPSLERSRNGRPTLDELREQLPDPGNDEICVEMLSRPAVGALCRELRRALQVNDRSIPGHAGVKAVVDKIARKTEALLVEGD